MKLPLDVRDEIVQISRKYIGRPYSCKFDCVTFVRSVYGEVGMEIPIIGSEIPPPPEFNILPEDIFAWEHGYIVFLKRRSYEGKRSWTHVGITIPNRKFIHCSQHFGFCVGVNSFEEIFSLYRHVPNLNL